MRSASIRPGGLQRYVVRIHDANGRLTGTGFVVAPGLILTNAHVVNGQRSAQLAREPGPAKLVPADVVAASEARNLAEASALWPFPDLAVLAADGADDWPCPLLSTDDPGRTADCYAWGYASRQTGVDPVGSAIAVQFVDWEGDGRLTLKGDNIRPGMSGAPLLSAERRAIVAVVAETRGAGNALGGYAIPIAALIDPDAIGTTPELLEIGRLIWAENRQAVLRHRQQWHELWDRSDTGTGLRQPWAEFVRGRRSQPSQMLVAEHMVVPYLFRGVELEAGIAWCEAPSERAISHVAGQGGSGKTRYAVELCRAMADRGWVAGILRPGSREICQVPYPRLIVIDYAEAAGNLVDLLADVSRSASDLAPVRVLLLTRTKVGTEDLLTELSGYAPLQQIVDDALSSDAAAGNFDVEARSTLYRVAVERFAAAWGVEVTREPPVVPNLGSPEYDLPLEILLDALLTVLRHEPVDDGAAPSRMSRMLKHEEKYWELSNPQLSQSARFRCVALATLAGADSEAAADRLLSLVPELPSHESRRRATAWLANLYAGDDVINPLRPDRLGEMLVAELLRRDGDNATELLRQVFTIGSTAQVVRTLKVLRRAGATEPNVALTVRAAIGAGITGLVGRAVDTASTGASLDLASALATLVAEQGMTS